MVKYFTVNLGSKFYRHRNSWTFRQHEAAFLTEDLAQRIAKRYPGSTVEENFGYEVNFQVSLEDVGEPEAVQSITDAVKLAARDGMSLQTILVQTEKAFHENGHS